MTSGVQFSTTFQPKGQLVQHFLSLNDGHAKDRLGTWELLGQDSLIVRDAQGPDTLRIVKLGKDYLELMRPDSIPLFFERKAPEGRAEEASSDNKTIAIARVLAMAIVLLSPYPQGTRA